MGGLKIGLWGAGDRVFLKKNFNFFSTLKKKKIGQCAISSTGMTFVFAYISHKWSKMPKNSFLGGLPFVKKTKGAPKKNIFQNSKTCFTPKLNFGEKHVFEFSKIFFWGALFVFFTKGRFC